MISTFFRADKLALASLFQSKDETQYYLNGVFIEASGNEGANAIATDGHRMGVFHDAAAFTSASCIVQLPKHAIDLIRKRKTREFCWFGIIGDHEGKGRHECRVFDTTGEAFELGEVRERMLDPKDRGLVWNGAIDLIDGTFPEWRKVVPLSIPKAGVSASYNGSSMKDFIAVAKDREPSACLTIHSNGRDPSIITAEREDFLGILMPMAGADPAMIADIHTLKAPSWIHGI